MSAEYVPCPDCENAIEPDQQLVCPVCDGSGVVPRKWLDDDER